MLFEQEPDKGDLLTFRLPGWPVVEPVEAKRLRDHRRLYLTYQGPISDNRGTVIRLAIGYASLSIHGGFLRLALPDGSALEFHEDHDDIYIVRPG